MDDAEASRRPAGRAPRSALARALSWVCRQILFKDGGVLATLRGVLAMALFTFAANLTPTSLLPSEVRWWLPIGLLGLAAVTVPVILVIRRRAGRQAKDEDQAPEIRVAARPDGVIEVSVQVRISQNAGSITVIEPVAQDPGPEPDSAVVRRADEGEGPGPVGRGGHDDGA